AEVVRQHARVDGDGQHLADVPGVDVVDRDDGGDAPASQDAEPGDERRPVLLGGPEHGRETPVSLTVDRRRGRSDPAPVMAIPDIGGGGGGGGGFFRWGGRRGG